MTSLLYSLLLSIISEELYQYKINAHIDILHNLITKNKIYISNNFKNIIETNGCNFCAAKNEQMIAKEALLLE